MDEVREKKKKVRADITKSLESLEKDALAEKYRVIEDRLFDFANFLESGVPLLYMHQGIEVPTESIVRRCYTEGRVVVFPVFDEKKQTATFYKVDNFDADMTDGPRKMKQPNPKNCKRVPTDRIDIAIIPGYVFDEKGGRLGSGMGYYDRLIPRLLSTTRKVALTTEEQIVPQVPAESHDRNVDIIITDQRIIYKI